MPDLRKGWGFQRKKATFQATLPTPVKQGKFLLPMQLFFYFFGCAHEVCTSKDLVVHMVNLCTTVDI